MNQETIRLILERLAAARSLGLFLDYDGTLAPFAPRPELALLPPKTRTVLKRLAAMPDVRVGIISSRRVAEVAELVGLDGIAYVGMCGLEWLSQDGNLERDVRLRRMQPVLEVVREAIEAAVKATPGAWMEDKRGTLTLHLRGVEASQVDALVFRAEAAVAKDGQGLSLERNVSTLEIRPGGAVDKGTALARLLDRRPATVAVREIPFYAGDDTNDGPALKLVNKRGGVAVGVGPVAPAAAEFCLASPEVLGDLLRSIALR